MKWLSRKLFIFFYVSILFSGFFYLTLKHAPQAVIPIAITIIGTIGFFASVVCGLNVLDKYVLFKHGDRRGQGEND